MCDFKPGDEVVCVDAVQPKNSLGHPWLMPLEEGQTYVINDVSIDQRPFPFDTGEVVVYLAGHPNLDSLRQRDFGFGARRFRKVERKNTRLSIEAFLTIKPGQFEDPKRTPAKKRERAR